MHQIWKSQNVRHSLTHLMLSLALGTLGIYVPEIVGDFYCLGGLALLAAALLAFGHLVKLFSLIGVTQQVNHYLTTQGYTDIQHLDPESPIYDGVRSNIIIDGQVFFKGRKVEFHPDVHVFHYYRGGNKTVLLLTEDVGLIFNRTWFLAYAQPTTP